MAPLTPWWPKLELKIWPHLAESIESQIMDGFWCSRCLNDHINLPDMIGSFASGAIAFIVAKNWTKTLSQLFKELQGSNLEFKLVTPNLFLGPYQDYFGTILGLFWGPFWEPFWDCSGIFGNPFVTILGPFWHHFGTILAPSGPTWPQDAPKMAQDASKLLQRWPKMLQETPRFL